MTAVLSDRDALLAAILRDPADDTVRLAFADWLDEHGEGAPAEFIRVQVELARLDPDEGDAGEQLARQHRLDRRERELFAAHCDDWFPVPPGYHLDWGIDTIGHDDGRPAFTVRRGFVAEVRCPLAAWRRHGPAVVRAHPVERVVLADKTPWTDDSGNPTDRSWWRDSAWDGRGDDPRGNLPDDLFDRIGELYPESRLLWGRPPSNQHVAFATVAKATDALSAACVAWAKSAP